MGQAKKTEANSSRKKRVLIALFVAVALSLVAYSLFDSLSQTDQDTPSDQRSEVALEDPGTPTTVTTAAPGSDAETDAVPSTTTTTHPPTTTTTAAPEVTTTETTVPSTDGTETTDSGEEDDGTQEEKGQSADTGEDVEKGGLGYGLGDEVRYYDPDPAGRNVEVGLDEDGSDEKGDGVQGGGKDSTGNQGGSGGQGGGGQ